MANTYLPIDFKRPSNTMKNQSKIKVMGLGGEKAVGKTTLVNRLLGELDKKHNDIKVVLEGDKRGKLRGHYYPSVDVLILGVYDDKTFSGTDRLSYSISPIFQKWIIEHKYLDVNVFFEGDRLFTDTTANFLNENNINHEFIILTADKETIKKQLKKREAIENKKEGDHFIKGRQTKMVNFKKNHKDTKVLKNQEKK